MYDFTPSRDDELPLKSGDFVVVIQEIDEDWAMGRCAGKVCAPSAAKLALYSCVRGGSMVLHKNAVSFVCTSVAHCLTHDVAQVITFCVQSLAGGSVPYFIH